VDTDKRHHANGRKPGPAALPASVTPAPTPADEADAALADGMKAIEALDKALTDLVGQMLLQSADHPARSAFAKLKDEVKRMARVWKIG
jgi:hypothetical protein